MQWFTPKSIICDYKSNTLVLIFPIAFPLGRGDLEIDGKQSNPNSQSKLSDYTCVLLNRNSKTWSGEKTINKSATIPDSIRHSRTSRGKSFIHSFHFAAFPVFGSVPWGPWIMKFCREIISIRINEFQKCVDFALGFLKVGVFLERSCWLGDRILLKLPSLQRITGACRRTTPEETSIFRIPSRYVYSSCVKLLDFLSHFFFLAVKIMRGCCICRWKITIQSRNMTTRMLLSYDQTPVVKGLWNKSKTSR